MNIMDLNYNVQGEERRKLVQIVAEIINTAAVYKKVPTCAYEISTFTVSKTGVLSWTEDTDVETVKTVVAGLQMMGLNAKEETKTVKKVFEMRPQAQPDAPEEPQEQPKDETEMQTVEIPRKADERHGTCQP